uniref:Uncharacterized protein n=1 Tax=Strongyloides venezuelensis TaxID=75913 RepID=A0A0K0F052_STRVS
MSNKNIKRSGRLVSPSSFKEYADNLKSDSNHSLSSGAGDNVLSDYAKSSGESSKKRRSDSGEASRKRGKSKSSERRPRKQIKKNLTTRKQAIEDKIADSKTTIEENEKNKSSKVKFLLKNIIIVIIVIFFKHF